MLDTIYIIQHSHTDLGFTHDQPIVDSLHGRFLRQALDYAECFGDAAPGERFCWTIETCGFLEKWLRQQPSTVLERLQRMEKEGQIEICALPDHTTPLSDLTDYHASLRLAEQLRREYGFRIDSAMNSDVNGQNWPFADALIDAGIVGYTTAINTHCGRSPLVRPTAFRWRTPSGRLLPVYHGPAYGYPGKLGISPGADLALLRDEWLPRMEAHLSANDYPLPILLLQSIHPFGDNGPADPDLLEYVRRWNATGHRLRIHFGTPRDWWNAVRPHLEKLPIYAGDWTDSWIFGAGSAARELSLQRATRPRLRAASTLLTAAQALKTASDVLPLASMTKTEEALLPTSSVGGPAPAAPGGYAGSPPSRFSPPDPTDLSETARDLHEAAVAQLRYQEHTWSADCACEHPYGDDAFTQSSHKRALAATARSLSTMAYRDVIAVLARHVIRNAPSDLLLFNPLPFPRVLTGLIGGSHAFPRGRRDDPIAGRHYQDRKLDYPLLELPARPENEWKQNPEFWLRPTEVPALGYVVISRSQACVDPFAEATDSAEPVVETPHYRLVFDLMHGGIASLICRAGGERELVDTAAPYPFHGYVHERVLPPKEMANPRRALFDMDWSSPELEPPLGWNAGYCAERLGPTRLVSHRVRRTALGVLVVQRLEAPGSVYGIEQHVWMPAHADWIEFTTRFIAPPDTAPQAYYVTFPFALAGATSRYDVGPLAVRPGDDQLPGVGCDYFCAQNWVDFSDDDFGVTIALPENPLFMIGGFNFARAAKSHPPDVSPHLIGFIANNFWETNYPVSQAGEIVARFRLQPHAGGFEETTAHRFGLDTAYRQAALQHLGERPAPGAMWPGTGSLFTLTAPDGELTPVQLLALNPREDGNSAELWLHNASNVTEEIHLSSGLLTLLTVENISCAGGVASAGERFIVTIPARRTITLAVTLTVVKT